MSAKGYCPCCYSGWLKKKGCNAGLWHRRYCSIADSVFTVYKDEAKTKIEQVLNITKSSEIITNFPDSNKRFAIKEDSTSNMIQFFAASPELTTSWVTALRASTLKHINITLDDFKIISVIGRGFYGKVMLVEKKDTKELYALKSIRKSKLIEIGRTNVVITERDVMMKAKHPFIANLLFSFQTPTKFYLGVEYAPGGDLNFHLEQIGHVNLSDARIYIAEIGIVIDYLHSLGIVYRDLKPENVLFARDGHIKLADFGLSKEISPTSFTTSFCGTFEYLAPEVVNHRPYSYKVDEWALGVLLFQMLTGATPFAAESRMRQCALIVEGAVIFPEGFDEDARDLCTKLLTKDPASRPAFSELKGHPFFAGLDFDAMLRKEISPSWIPELGYGSSTEHFSTDITSESVKDSFVAPAIGMENVSGFSFTEETFN